MKAAKEDCLQGKIPNSLLLLVLAAKQRRQVRKLAGGKARSRAFLCGYSQVVISRFMNLSI